MAVRRLLAASTVWRVISGAMIKDSRSVLPSPILSLKWVTALGLLIVSPVLIMFSMHLPESNFNYLPWLKRCKGTLCLLLLPASLGLTHWHVFTLVLHSHIHNMVLLLDGRRSSTGVPEKSSTKCCIIFQNCSSILFAWLSVSSISCDKCNLI